MNILPLTRLDYHTGYIAGAADGIVTVGGVPAARPILVLDSLYNKLKTTYSLKNGHYMVSYLDPAKQYIIVCIDHKGEYAPVVWDNVSPMNDKTLEEQRELWRSWQG